jgi:hypothetical protein
MSPELYKEFRLEFVRQFATLGIEPTDETLDKLIGDAIIDFGELGPCSVRSIVSMHITLFLEDLP